MGIINREKAPSEQRFEYSEVVGSVATGVTVPIALIPELRMIEQCNIAALGCSGSPVLTFGIQRFNPAVGSSAYGFTFITGQFATLTVQNYGTSGFQGMSLLVALGNSLLITQAGDVAVFQSSGANTAIALLATNLEVRALQDYRSFFGATFLP